MAILVGIVGKTNVGKSTFFSAATLVSVDISNHPFTTIKANVGVGYLRKKCVCTEFGVKDNPQNSICIKGFRFIPVKLYDVAGLIPGAHKGRGLGNKFLDDLRQADALIHIVDAAGSTDANGRPVPPGTHDPLEDVMFVEREVDLWLYQILSRDWKRIARTVDAGTKDLVTALCERLAGLSIDRQHIIEALRQCKLESSKASSIREEELLALSSNIRKISKPMLIAANKSDLPEAWDNIKRMREELKGKYTVVPVSAISELALRKASKAGLIEYLPGDPDFKVIRPEALTEKQRKGLEYIKDRVLAKWGSTGVQDVINKAFFELLDMIVVYPVEDPTTLTDHKGNVLPDAFLVRRGTTVRQLAYMIHTELGKTFLYAIDVRTRRRLGESYVLRDNDVVKIVAAGGE